MDSITQASLGAAIGYLGFDKDKAKKALLIGAILGTLPDLDVLFTTQLPIVSQLFYHRGFSHSIIFALLATYPITWILKKKRLRDYITVFLILFTHSILDLFTTWGTQLLWPLPQRFAISNLFIIDPTYTFCLLIPIIGILLKKSGRKAMELGVFFSCLYILFTLCAKQWVGYRFLSDLNEKGIAPIRYSVKTTAFNSILWCLQFETEKAFYIGYTSLLSRNISPYYPVLKNKALPKALRKDKEVQRLLFLTNGFYTIQKVSESSTEDRYLIQDLRFGQGTGWETGNGKPVFQYQIKRRSSEKAIHIEQIRFNDRQYADYFSPFPAYFIGKFSND